FRLRGHAHRPGARRPPLARRRGAHGRRRDREGGGRLAGGVPHGQRDAHVGAGRTEPRQIGEFSFIIAGLGLALHATGEFLYPVAVAVSALTTLLTPWMIRASEPIAAWVDRKLPRPLQTFAALYGSWLEVLRSRRPGATAMTGLRRMLRLLVLDAALIAAIIMVTSASMRLVVAFARDRLGLPEPVARALAIAAAIALATPFCVGVVRIS